MVHGLETIKAINAEAVANQATILSDVEKQKLVDAIDLATDWLQLQQDDYEAMQDAMPSDSDGERELDEIELKCMAAMWTCINACKKVVNGGN